MCALDFPRISVVIPNYNHAPRLQAALESVCSQDPPPHDVHVFDDCSTDNSWEVIESFMRRYPFVHGLRYPRKSPDWQRACYENIARVSGDWVLALAADDLIYPGFLKAVGEMAARYPHCGIVVPDVDNITTKYGAVPVQRGWPNMPFLDGERMEQKLREVQVSECGALTLIRKDAVMWLVQNNATDMGPWFDSIGFGVVALMHGACYVPRVLGAVYCSTGDHPTWSEAFHHDSNQAIRTFEHVAHFLRASEAASYVPADIALILEAKVVLGLSAEIKNPLLLPRLFNQTHELIRSGRLQEADRWLAWIIGLNDVLPDLRLDWGVVQLALGRSADAEASFRRALELNPNLASAYSNLGVCLQRRGAVEEAIWAYRRAVQIDPQFGSAYANLGRLLSTHGRHEEALPAMQMAMQLNPQL